MKLKIVYYDKRISWKKKWIFLGSSFKNLQHAEKKIKGKRIKINKFLHEIYKEELPSYLKWTENQRIHFNDDVYWWMTDLAGRNNLESNFFLYICQIKSLKKILKNTEENEVLIVCDNILLIQAVKENLNEHQVEAGANITNTQIYSPNPPP